MRGLPGSWERGIETLRRLRAIEHAELSGRGRHDALREERRRASMPRSPRSAPSSRISSARDLHLNIGHESAHYFANAGYLSGSAARILSPRRSRRIAPRSPIVCTRCGFSRIATRRSSAGTTRRTSLRCRARRSPRRASSIRTGSCIRARSGTSRSAVFASRTSICWQLWKSQRTKDVRAAVVDEQCPHCWTPCEAYPTILGNLARAVSPFAPSHD